MDYPNGYEIKGEKGKQFCVQYVKKITTIFHIKGVLAGGEHVLQLTLVQEQHLLIMRRAEWVVFGDLQGYIYENGKYYAKAVLGKRYCPAC